MPDVEALLAAQEAAALEAAGEPDTTGLVPLLFAADAIAGAVRAILCGDRPRAAQCLREASAAAAHAFPDPGSRESFSLAIVLGWVTEQAGAVT